MRLKKPKVIGENVLAINEHLINIEFMKNVDFKLKTKHIISLSEGLPIINFSNDKLRDLISTGISIEYSYLTAEEFKVFSEEAEYFELPYYCQACEQYITTKFYNDGRIETDNEVCEPIKPIDITISVPSGELIICDWIHLSRDLLASLDESELINYRGERKNRTNRYARENVLHVFTAGESPDVIHSNKSIHFKSSAFNNSGKCGDFLGDGIYAGRVYGDLNWITLIDKQILLNRAKDLYPLEYDVLKAEIEVLISTKTILSIKVDKGIYKGIHYYDTEEYDKKTLTHLDLIINEKGDYL